MTQAPGGHLYWQAVISAQLGERERAVSELQEAFSLGVGLNKQFHRDPIWQPLRDYPTTHLPLDFMLGGPYAFPEKTSCHWRGRGQEGGALFLIPGPPRLAVPVGYGQLASGPTYQHFV
jgi:hypothetical protein